MRSRRRAGKTTVAPESVRPSALVTGGSTGRVVIAHEGPREVGLAAEVASALTERCFHFLEAAPVRVTGHDIPYPPSKLEKHHLPDLDRMLDGIDRVLGRVKVGS